MKYFFGGKGSRLDSVHTGKLKRPIMACKRKGRTMLAIWIAVAIHTFGAELLRRALRAPGRVSSEALQLSLFMLLWALPTLLKAQFGYLMPGYALLFLAVAAVLATSLMARGRSYWLLTAFVLLVDGTLAAPAWHALGTVPAVMLALVMQAMVAVFARRRARRFNADYMSP
jgi:hypothetical protein